MKNLEPRGKIKIDIDGKPLYVVGTSSCISYYKDEAHQIHHRLGGPAVISFSTRTKQWWKDGYLHREGGPAVVCRRTYRELTVHWYINGVRYLEEDYKKYYVLEAQKRESNLIHPDLDSLYVLDV